MYRVAIVDDEGMPRRVLSQEIERKAPLFQLAGAFRTGDQAWAFLQREEVDILVTDIKMPGMSGLELARRVAARWPDTVTGIITGYSEFEYARQAIGLGVSSFLLKPLNLKEFADALSHMGRQRSERLQRRMLQAPAAQDVVNEFLMDLQEGLLRGEERSRRFQACRFAFSEENCRGELISVRLESEPATGSEQECSAIKNVLRMSFRGCWFFDLGREGGELKLLMLCARGEDWRPEEGARALADNLGRQAEVRIVRQGVGLDAVERLLASCGRAREAGESQDPLVERAIAYIAEHYQEDVTRYDVATHLYLNPGYFGRLFKQKTGETFGDYLVKTRMQKAIELLFSSCSVAQISEMVGYSNPSSFTRVFRLYTSYTPTEYRRQVIRRGDE